MPPHDFPIHVRNHQGKNLFYAIVGTFAFVGTLVMVIGFGMRDWPAWAILGATPLLIAFFVWQLLDRSPCLILTEHGIQIPSKGEATIPYRAIKEFECVQEAQETELLRVYLRTTGDVSESPSQGKGIQKPLLIDCSRVSPELAEIAEVLRAQIAREPSGPPPGSAMG